MFEDYTLLNNWLLTYKSKPLEELYLEENRDIQRYIFYITCICGCILQIFFVVFNGFVTENITDLGVSVVFLLSWIVILLGGMYNMNTTKYTLLIFCIAYTLYVSHRYINTIDTYIKQLERNETFIVIFIYGLIYITYISIVVRPINCFISKVFGLNFACLYLGISIIISKSSNILWIAAVLCLLCYNSIYYFEERSSKIQFIEKYQQKKQLEGWKTLLHESFPVGVVIAKIEMKEQKLNVIFSNKTCQDLFSDSSNSFIEQQLQLIQVDPSMQKANGLVADHRIENSMFIGQEQKQNLSDQIIKYFNQNRGDRKRSIIQLGKPYCSFGYYLNEKQEKNYFNIIANNIAWENESCFLIVFKDVSQKMMYDRLQEIDQYKDQLLASVTHELKTPLNGILSIVQVAQQEEDIIEIKKQLELIKQSGNILDFILNDILDYSRLQKQKLRLMIKKFDIVNTIDDVISILSIQFIKPEIEIIKEIDIKERIIQSDSNRLKQIIFNLLTNAIKFTQKGQIKIIVKQFNQQCLLITVSDTGVGIPKTLQKQLFKLYGTFDHSNGSNRHGVGLGLVITKSLVALLGPSDHIELESKVGEGSAFSFQIYQELNQNENSLTSFHDLDEEEEQQENLDESIQVISPFDPHSNHNNNNNNHNNNNINNNNNVNNHNHLQEICLSPQMNFNNIILEIENSRSLNDITNNNNNINNTNQTQRNAINDQQQIKTMDDSPLKQESFPLFQNEQKQQQQQQQQYSIQNDQVPNGLISKNIFSSHNLNLNRKQYIYRKSSVQTYNTPTNKPLAQALPQLNCASVKRHRNSYIDTNTLNNNNNNNNNQNLNLNQQQNHLIDENINNIETPSYQKQYIQLNSNNNNNNKHQFYNQNSLNEISNNNNQSKQYDLMKQKTLSPNTSPIPRKSYQFSTIAKQSSKSFQETSSPSPSSKLVKKNQFCHKQSFDIESTNILSKSHSETNIFDIIFKKRTRILIVDDIYFNVTVLKLLLGKCQYLVIDEAYNGQQALDKIEEQEKNGDPYQLVFMDMNMPVMDGVQAIEIIRQKIKDKQLSDLKIAVCSAFSDLQSKMKCLKAGADLHIVKPIDKSEMECQLMQIYNVSLDTLS